MSAKNKKLLAVLGAAAVVVIVIAAVLLGKGGQTTTVDPASTPSDVSAEDVDSSSRVPRLRSRKKPRPSSLSLRKSRKSPCSAIYWRLCSYLRPWQQR